MNAAPRTLSTLLVVAALHVAGCDPEPSLSYSAERYRGGCRDPLPAGAAAGEGCVDASDCAAFCCACAAQADVSYGGQVCLDGLCADVEAACATVEGERPDLCVVALVVEQGPDGTCPATLKEGVAAGESCTGADDCEGACCTCPGDAARAYAVSRCGDDGTCSATTDACAAAVAADPTLCP